MAVGVRGDAQLALFDESRDLHPRPALVFPTMDAAEPPLYGRPVSIVPDLPTSAANARSIVFGDIEAAYTVRRVRGPGLRRLDELFSDNGQVGFGLGWRLDGRPVDLAAAIILRRSAT